VIEGVARWVQAGLRSLDQLVDRLDRCALTAVQILQNILAE
jgi:hypothetical protein